MAQESQILQSLPSDFPRRDALSAVLAKELEELMVIAAIDLSDAARSDLVAASPAVVKSVKSQRRWSKVAAGVTLLLGFLVSSAGVGIAKSEQPVRHAALAEALIFIVSALLIALYVILERRNATTDWIARDIGSDDVTRTLDNG